MNKYFHVNETIYEDNIKRAISDVETKYKIEKIENENKEKQRLLEEKQKNNQKIILIFIALFAFSTILFYFFYQNLRLKQKNKFIEFDRQIKQNIINATIDGQEIERKNIATILHDSISALLSSAGLHLSAYSANNPTEHSEEIKKTRAILKEAHDNVRDLSHELIPPLLAKFGIFHALQDLCEKNSNSILQFEYSSYVPQGKRYNEEFEMRVYFIIAELFNNIMKHSKASKAYITLEENGDQLLITIEDDGKGFDTSKELSSDGFGLTQIKSRIKHLKGSITINSKINAGTLIYIKIQISKA
ncbi:Signal transduction histidine-protein kinase/phosphatase DegS [compost metagenome]